MLLLELKDYVQGMPYSIRVSVIPVASDADYRQFTLARQTRVL